MSLPLVYESVSGDSLVVYGVSDVWLGNDGKLSLSGIQQGQTTSAEKYCKYKKSCHSMATTVKPVISGHSKI